MQTARNLRFSLLFAAAFFLCATLFLLHTFPIATYWTTRSIHPPALHPLRPLRRDVETCTQWHGALRQTGGELHYYLIGAQKSGTSTLSKYLRFHSHANSSRGAPKEFHFLTDLLRNGKVDTYVSNRTKASMSDIRRREMHNAGFSGLKNVSREEFRKHPELHRHGDATPRYMLSEEAARVAHMLHPHARILVALRDPVARAVSHLNMAALYAHRENDTRLSRYFDYTLREEMRAAKLCGWNTRTGTISTDGNERFSDAFGHFARCVSTEKRRRYGQLKDSDLSELAPRIHDWFVLRGLYADILPQWMHYFPHSRILVVEFGDIVCDMTKLLRKMEKFLCLPPFSDAVYEKSKMLKCQQVKSRSERAGNNPLPSPQVLAELREFYAMHNKRLRGMMHHYFRGQTRLDWGY